MRTKLFNAIKVSLLAIILSFGLSFVYAWTAPSGPAPTGTLATPINTGGTLQLKAGGLTVGSLSAGSGVISTTGNISGWALSADSLTAKSVLGGNLELGWVGAVTTPYIDFHYNNNTAQDYNVRLINDANNTLHVYNSASTGDICAQNGKCLSAAGGGVVKYGGGYLMDSKSGACKWSSNIATGACTCPAGYTARLSSYSVETSGAWYAAGYTCESL